MGTATVLIGALPTYAQWGVAALNPPHLAAINPWEGWSDTYNEIVRHGGIPETSFWPYIWERWGASTTPTKPITSPLPRIASAGHE